MFEIQVANRQSLISIDPAWIEHIVSETLLAENVSGAEIDVAILDDAAIHVVNRDHLQHDFPTDVISFLYAAEPETAVESGSTSLRGAGLVLEGELLVSAETALRTAREVDWPVEAELTLYLVHGLLHLCGYDDLTDDERVMMRARERDVLQKWSLIPHDLA